MCVGCLCFEVYALFVCMHDCCMLSFYVCVCVSFRASCVCVCMLCVCDLCLWCVRCVRARLVLVFVLYSHVCIFNMLLNGSYCVCCVYVRYYYF